MRPVEPRPNFFSSLGYLFWIVTHGLRSLWLNTTVSWVWLHNKCRKGLTILRARLNLLSLLTHKHLTHRFLKKLEPLRHVTVLYLSWLSWKLMLSLTLIIDLEAFAEDLEFFVLQQAIKNKTDYSLELLFLDYLSKNPAKSLTKLSINCFFFIALSFFTTLICH